MDFVTQDNGKVETDTVGQVPSKCKEAARLVLTSEYFFKVIKSLQFSFLFFSIKWLSLKVETCT